MSARAFAVPRSSELKTSASTKLAALKASASTGLPAASARAYASSSFLEHFSVRPAGSFSNLTSFADMTDWTCCALKVSCTLLRLRTSLLLLPWLRRLFYC